VPINHSPSRIPLLDNSYRKEYTFYFYLSKNSKFGGSMLRKIKIYLESFLKYNNLKNNPETIKKDLIKFFPEMKEFFIHYDKIFKEGNT